MRTLQRAFKFEPMKNGHPVIDLGMFLIEVRSVSKTKIHDVRNKSLISGAGGNYVEMPLNVALEKVKAWFTYAWNHNDRQYLINEYGLNKEIIKDFLGYSTNGLEFPEGL